MIAKRLAPMMMALTCIMMAPAAFAEGHGHAGHGGGHRIVFRGHHQAPPDFRGNTVSGNYRRHVDDRDAATRNHHRGDMRRDVNVGGEAGSIVEYRGSTTSQDNYGTFSGSTWAWRDRGNGVYFGRDGWSEQVVDVPAERSSGPKIITVGQNYHDSRYDVHDGCSYEEGVCVIRGGN